MDRFLWILRHAKAAADPPGGGTDHERPLAPRGRRDADALGRRLGDGGDRLGLPEDCLPGLVLCSTATRTVQTTERVVAGFAVPPEIDYRRTLYGASPEEVLDELRTIDDGTTAVMVVGHNPTVHTLATGLLPGDTDRDTEQLADRTFPTCALAVYHLPTHQWRDIAPSTANLLRLVTPPFS